MKEEYLDELKTRVSSYSLDNDVKFLGFTNEPHKFMQACDCVIMASKKMKLLDLLQLKLCKWEQLLLVQTLVEY